MIFRQLFDSVSGTYSYLLASRAGGEALILDPVLEKVDRYCQLLRELDLRLVKAVDTHLHADHITGLGELRDRTQCVTIMGEQTRADVVAMRVSDGDKVMIEGLSLDVMYTPGHTDDSYSYLMGDRVFTGDTLLIRGTGRTDFQNGSARAQYDSIFGRLLKLPDETMVFPAHDYKGDTVSTIGEEKRYNPRLQVRSVDEYIELMNNLKLPNPKLMDVVLPAVPISCWWTFAKPMSAPNTGCCQARFTRRIPESAKACSPAGCCAKWRLRPDGVSCFSVRSANAPRWR
jgi:glyoxylase-like metal-dependent hydrolase (beta-lactamase superfamily II)